MTKFGGQATVGVTSMTRTAGAVSPSGLRLHLQSSLCAPPWLCGGSPQDRRHLRSPAVLWQLHRAEANGWRLQQPMLLRSRKISPLALPGVKAGLSAQR